MRKDNELRSAGQESVELVESQAAIVLYVQYSYAGTRALCRQLPRNQTRVMLRYGKDHFVSGTEVSAPQDAATRLMASVVPRVHTISSGPRAFTNFATFSLAFCYNAAHLRARVWRVGEGFAFSCK